MKYVYALLLTCWFLTGTAAAEKMDRSEINALWDRANHAYTNGNYEDAAAGYDSLLNAGYEGAKLYYNLGNAYFKTGRIGLAVLNYNKALLRSPGDGDIRYNLEIARSHTVDRIEEVPRFFLKRWTQHLRMMLGSNGWAVVSLIAFGTMLACVLLYLLAGRLVLKKAGFYLAIVLLAVFAASAAFASRQRALRLRPAEAVVISSAAPVKSSPDGSSKDIFILHEGTKVQVLDELQEWREVMIADGNKGWIRTSAIALID